MGAYKSAILTTAGQNLIAQALAGNSAVKFTALKTSNYSYPANTNFEALTSLQGVKQSTGITSAIVVNQTTVKISARVSNVGITSAYYINTIGVYAETNGITETLIAVIPASNADLVPAYSTGAPYSFIYDINLTIQNSSSLNVTINDSGVATVADLQRLSEKTYNVYVTDTASGEVASFADGADEIPMESVNVTMAPIQSFNGYDSPWPDGGGKNKIKPNTTGKTADGLTFTVNADGSVTITGTSTKANVFLNLNYAAGALAFPTGRWKLCGGSSNVNVQVAGYPSGYLITSNSKTVFTNVNVPSTDTVTWVRVQVPTSGTTVNETVYPMLCAESETNTTFAPYSNICPISGWNAVNATRTGKNILENNVTKSSANGISLTRNADGSFVINGETETATIVVVNFSGDFAGANQNDEKKHIPNGTYTITGSENDGLRFQLSCSNKKGNSEITNIFSAKSGTVTVDDTYKYNWVRLYAAPGTYDNVIIRPMIRPVSVDDNTYEQYKGEKYITNLPAGFFGGSVDSVSGLAESEWAEIASYNGEPLPGEWLSSYDKYEESATPTTGAQVVYKLAEPQTIQLEPTEIDSLYGYNNVWSDAGDVTVKYRADTALYINKKIAEMQALILENS